MRTFVYITLTVLSSVLFFGCETEVDLYSDYKQRVVLFALLDPGSEVQYFRVNPTFLGDEDGRIVAGNPDQSNFDPNEVLVQLIDLTSDQIYTCSETTDIPLDPDGIFSTQNRLYYLNSEIDTIDNQIVNNVLQAGHSYRLVVTHQITGEVTYAETTIPDFNQIRMVIPNKNSLSTDERWMKFHSGTQYVLYSFFISRAAYVERYFVKLRYHYTEPGDNPESKEKYVDIQIGEVRTEDVTGTSIQLEFNGEQFYNVLKNKLDGKTQLTGQRSDIFLTAMGRELDAYIQVNNAAINSISQELTSYSNVVNGLGIFSFKATRLFDDIILNGLSADEVRNGLYTSEIFQCSRFGSTGDSRGVVSCD